MTLPTNNYWGRSIVNTMIAHQQEGHHRIGADLLSEETGFDRDVVIDEAKKCAELVVEEQFDKVIIYLKG